MWPSSAASARASMPPTRKKPRLSARARAQRSYSSTARCSRGGLRCGSVAPDGTRTKKLCGTARYCSQSSVGTFSLLTHHAHVTRDRSRAPRSRLTSVITSGAGNHLSDSPPSHTCPHLVICPRSLLLEYSSLPPLMRGGCAHARHCHAHTRAHPARRLPRAGHPGLGERRAHVGRPALLDLVLPPQLLDAVLDLGWGEG